MNYYCYYYCYYYYCYYYYYYYYYYHYKWRYVFSDWKARFHMFSKIRHYCLPLKHMTRDAHTYEISDLTEYFPPKHFAQNIRNKFLPVRPKHSRKGEKEKQEKRLQSFLRYKETQ